MDDDDGHRYFEGLAVAHVLGGLDDSEGRVFRSHLLECGTCRARVGELRAIAHDLADVERDERRVRAAQAIDTKRREADEELDETAEQVPSPRSSRMTVIVGLVMIIGLSLWNFTLRSALEVQQTAAANLRSAGVIMETGTAWNTRFAGAGVDGSVAHKDDLFVVAADGLKAGTYAVYQFNAGDVEVQRDDLIVGGDGVMYVRLGLIAEATRVVVYRPSGDSGAQTDKPTGTKVFEAERPE
jgi:hypothetical protein